MSFRSPKGFKQYGDVLDLVVENINKQLIDFENIEVRNFHKEFVSKDIRVVIFNFTEKDVAMGNKIPIYLESIASIKLENEILTDIKYVNDFDDKVYIAYKLRFI